MTTEDIDYDEWWRWVQNSLMNECPGLYDKIELYEDGEFEYRDNGIGFMIRFVGENGPKT